MKIIFWGTPEYSIKTLEVLIKSDHEILAVVTQPDKKRSRGGKLIPSPIKKLAELYAIPCICPSKIKDNKDFVNTLRKKDCDIFIVIAYGKILSQEILDIPKFGSWNAHASLLPRWRGAAPIHWALLSGDTLTGVGIMKMEKGLDTGNILLEEKISIESNDNLITLTKKLSKLSAKLVLNSLKVIEKGPRNLKTRPQIDIDRKIKYARMINKLDYFIKFSDSALNINRKVKGLYPRAYINFKNKNLKILSVKILSKEELVNKYNIKMNHENIEPGKIIGIIQDLGFIVSTNTEPILILEAKLEGKKSSSKKQLLQQLRPEINTLII